ncbi:MAG: hypothetical protein DF168_02288 [Candidatus Moanabacter tarae]|uniref:Uncharacterized protein n=1 Tax=Candidatus Moanibacter tarae TaxID=2200854 RepID=A0A2Z4AS95_9BACT|nr:MAG: hypothetical protein DF168_02288 [Candidatus Moanabacter tarae]|tara:strand:+ start:110455 stop:110661 length:207 start_codon:yes stop_codon:yes gene_type:complete
MCHLIPFVLAQRPVDQFLEHDGRSKVSGVFLKIFGMAAVVEFVCLVGRYYENAFVLFGSRSKRLSFTI